jgi:hypothetical protein
MRRIVIATTAVLFACGPAAAPPAKTAAPAKAPPATAVATYDVSAVPAPPGLAATARFADPAATKRALVVLFGKAFPPLEAMTPQRLVAFAVGDPITDVLDLARPVDVAMLKGEGGKVEAAASAAVLRIEDARKELAEDYRFGAPAADGVIALTPISAGEHPLGVCELRPAFGDPGHRMVCATSAGALEAAGPYLARTAPRITATADLHLDVNMVGADAIPFQASSPPTSAAEAAGQRFGRDIVVEMVRDIARLVADVTLTPDGAKVACAASFPGVSSSLARVGLTLTRDPGQLPDSFWRLPADADVAFYSRGVSREDYGALRGDLLAMVAQAFKSELAPSMAERTRALADRILLTGGPVLYAHGFDAEAARDAVNAAVPMSEPDRRAEADALAGWTLVAVDEPSGPWADAAREVAALVKLESDPKEHPKGWSPREAGAIVPVTAASGLPDGTVHFELRDVPQPTRGRRKDDPPPPFPLTDHLFVVPDGARTWLAFGRSEPRLLSKLGVAMGRDTKGSTLRDRAGLDALHAASTGFGGFLTVGAFASSDAPKGPPWGSDRGSARRVLDRVHELPEHGTTPIPFFLGGHRTGAGGELTVDVELPRAAIAAILARATH